MQIYQSLIPPYQQIVDRLVAYARFSDWQTMRVFLASTYEKLTLNAEKFPAIEPEVDFSHMVAAMIERLEAPRVADADQAVVYAVSAEVAHRDASEDWFASHPQEFDAIWASANRGTLH